MNRRRRLTGFGLRTPSSISITCQLPEYPFLGQSLTLQSQKQAVGIDRSRSRHRRAIELSCEVLGDLDNLLGVPQLHDDDRPVGALKGAHISVFSDPEAIPEDFLQEVRLRAFRE